MTATNGKGDQAPELLTFPCTMDVKAIGRRSPRFEALVQQLVLAHIRPQDLLAISHRESRGATYVSVTVSIRAESRAQLDAIYQSLSDCPDVLMAL